jgi:DNA polymerase-4
MVHDKADIVHINVTNFAAAVAIAKEPSLADTPFVMAREGSSRQVVIAPSRRAMEEGIHAGMPVATALRIDPALKVVSPDMKATAQAEAMLCGIASRFSPTVQHDLGGHLYIDVSGTSRLFGPPMDCAVRIRNEIHAGLNMDPAVAVATNKLVAKVGTRAIRPCGITYVKAGDESSFLAMQDIALLPGVGPSIGKLLSVAGFQDIGQLAVLDDHQITALLGTRGIALRNAARGWDTSPVDPRDPGARDIRRRIDFAEPTDRIDALRAAMVATAEDAGLAMRRELLSCSSVRCAVFWADGSTSEGSERTKSPLILDEQIIDGAWSALQKALKRRVKIRSMALVLRDLSSARREPDLFTPPGYVSREDRLQTAVDATRLRFGVGAITHAAAVFHV